MQLAKKIFSLLLVVLVVGYSGGINIAKHLCDGEVVAKAVNHEVKVCNKAESTTPFSDDPSYSKKSCCDTELNFFQSDTFSKTSVVFDFFAVPTQVEVFVPTEIASSDNSEQNYSPPLLHSPPIYEFIEQYLI